MTCTKGNEITDEMIGELQTLEFLAHLHLDIAQWLELTGYNILNRDQQCKLLRPYVWQQFDVFQFRKDRREFLKTYNPSSGPELFEIIYHLKISHKLIHQIQALMNSKQQMEWSEKATIGGSSELSTERSKEREDILADFERLNAKLEEIWGSS